MEIKIEKSVDVKVDKSLGYPLAFFEAKDCGEEFFQKLKAKLFDYVVGRMSSRHHPKARLDINSEEMAAALKECALIASYLDMGYVCYPAGNFCLSNGGGSPRHIMVLSSSILETDREIGERLYDLALELKKPIEALLQKKASKPAAAEVLIPKEGTKKPALVRSCSTHHARF